MEFFKNAEEVLDFGGLTFDGKPETSTIQKPEVETKEKESTDGQTQDPPKVEDKDQEGGTVTVIDNDENLDLTLEGLEFHKEEETKDEDSDKVSPYIEFANNLAENVFGGTMEPYEGFDPDAEPTLETVVKLVNHNLEIRDNTVLENFFDSVSPLTQRIISYDLDSKGEDVDQYIRTLAEEQSIRSLNVENELDQERIIRTWHQQEGDSTTEIDERVAELKQAGLLAKEAGRIKPKLDKVAEDIAKSKEEDQRRIKEIETRYRDAYVQRVQNFLSKDKIGSISLSKEESRDLGLAMVGDNVELPLPNGKKVSMPYLEALITVHRYSEKEPLLENLALATLLLTKPELFEEKYRKQIETKVTNEVVKDIKYDNSKKAGQLKVTESPKKGTVKDSPWKLKW